MVKCAIALGSNQGNSLNILEDSLTALGKIPGITLENTSNWYQTKPQDTPTPQPDYLNGCALLSVDQTPDDLLAILQATEIQFGRVDKGTMQPRTLDLDLLLYGDLVLNLPHLTIPHPRMTQRGFVLVPLAEIAADWIEPISGKSIATLLKNVNTSGVQPYAIG
ncbi:2-amino-4-hydroxy-6-hydroxymethyldihydropteridine pyrophosphokinase [Chondrocystis sp. NIES-4102]|nr:2-amino-4-hydroxy-6-hydroxymethyldihydropteridine pyrophosphokinase [Chondrocystis sp. NIES-4102]